MNESTNIPQEFIEQAQFLASHSEILPSGELGLAQKLHEAHLSNRKLNIKLGVDPTSSDLHIGHTVCLNKLRKFQDLGHNVILIIGGFTAQIGDPSGRNATRPSLTFDQVQSYAQTYIDQVGLILDLKKTKIVNNNDWLSILSLKEILHLSSKITLNQMLAKEAFGDRLAKGEPLAFHELFYPLLQAYDSVAIDSDIELGGTDQRFNILQGRDLQAKLGKNQQLAMLLPLLEGTCGKQKMSKTYDNYIALKHSPQEMFGRTMRLNDNLIIKYFELATNLNQEAINQHKSFIENGGNPNELKKELAKTLVKIYHSEQDSHNALEQWNNIHSGKSLPQDIQEHKLETSLSLSKLLVHTNLASSSSEAKRLINEGAVKINNDTIKDANLEIDPKLDKFKNSIVQIGRRKFVKITN